MKFLPILLFSICTSIFNSSPNLSVTKDALISKSIINVEEANENQFSVTKEKVLNISANKPNQITILSMPSKGVAVVDNNGTPNQYSDDFISYYAFGEGNEEDHITYITRKNNIIVDTTILRIKILN